MAGVQALKSSRFLTCELRSQARARVLESATRPQGSLLGGFIGNLHLSAHMAVKSEDILRVLASCSEHTGRPIKHDK